MDEEHARTAKLRKLMRDFNRLGDEKSAFALELELTTADHILFYVTLELMVDGMRTPVALATASHGLVSLSAYTSMRLVPMPLRPLSIGHATIGALWETARAQHITVLYLDPGALHAVGICWQEGKMKFVPMREAAEGIRRARKGARSEIMGQRPQRRTRQ